MITQKEKSYIKSFVHGLFFFYDCLTYFLLTSIFLIYFTFFFEQIYFTLTFSHKFREESTYSKCKRKRGEDVRDNSKYYMLCILGHKQLKQNRPFRWSLFSQINGSRYEMKKNLLDPLSLSHLLSIYLNPNPIPSLSFLSVKTISLSTRPETFSSGLKKKMATANALTSASVLCSPRQVKKGSVWNF